MAIMDRYQRVYKSAMGFASIRVVNDGSCRNYSSAKGDVKANIIGRAMLLPRRAESYKAIEWSDSY
jgi:hypothetical protein